MPTTNCTLLAVKMWYEMVYPYESGPYYTNLCELVAGLMTATKHEQWFCLITLEAGVRAQTGKTTLPSTWPADVRMAYLRTIELLCRCYERFAFRLNDLKGRVETFGPALGRHSNFDTKLFKLAKGLLPRTPPDDKEVWLGRILDRAAENEDGSKNSICLDGFTFIASGEQLIVLERPLLGDTPVRVFDANAFIWVKALGKWVLKVRGLREGVAVFELSVVGNDDQREIIKIQFAHAMKIAASGNFGGASERVCGRTGHGLGQVIEAGMGNEDKWGGEVVLLLLLGLLAANSVSLVFIYTVKDHNMRLDGVDEWSTFVSSFWAQIPQNLKAWRRGYSQKLCRKPLLYRKSF